MSELHNPLFNDEREFLERQKLEYERALLGDVDHLKDRTARIGKYVAIGAAVVGGVWLVSKVLSGGDDDEYDYPPRRKGKGKRRKARLMARSDGSYPRAQLAPAVYHAEADPFPAFDAADADDEPGSARSYQQTPPQYRTQPEEPQSSLVVETLKALANSDAGKMLIGQLSGVLIALVTRKINDLMDVSKNADLAASANEPETKDIDFVIHHDDAHAPNPPA